MRQAVLIAVTAALSVVFYTASASAQNNRTFVSGGGSDSNPCSRSAPCRSFGAAIGVTNAGGEITVLDNAGYGPFTISKAITVSAIGVEAAITATTTDGITIKAGVNDIVTLRGLTLTQSGNASNLHGITFDTGGTLNIQNCVVRGFSDDGMNLVPTNTANINISDTTVSNSGLNGISILSIGAVITAFFERVQVNNVADAGFFINSFGATVNAMAVNSIATGNRIGFALAGNNSALMVVNSQASGNGTGFQANMGTMIIAKTTVYKNTKGIVNQSTMKTFGNNYFARNGSNTGTLTPVAQQ